MEAPKPAAPNWIKTECGRAKYTELAGRPGAGARLRLAWFVLIAAIRDWRLPDKKPLPREGPMRPLRTLNLTLKDQTRGMRICWIRSIWPPSAR